MEDQYLALCPGIVLFSLLMVWTELITVARSVKIFATIYFTKEQYISTFVCILYNSYSSVTQSLCSLIFVFSAIKTETILLL